MRWLHMSIVCAYAITTVVLTSVMVYYLPSEDTNVELIQLSQTLENWNTDVIEDIIVVQPSSVG
jgi:hypothetical protein